MKSCIACFEVKRLGDFYRHPAMADGYLNKCKECCKSYANQRRSENIDERRAYDRARSDQPHRISARKNNAKRRHDDPVLAEIDKKRSKDWIAKNPEKRSAHIALGNAVRDGRVVKQPCEICRTTKNVEGHHHDYSKPLDVHWLCKECHGIEHRIYNAIERLSV